MYDIVRYDSLLRIYTRDSDLMIYLGKIQKQYSFEQCSTDLEKLKSFKAIEMEQCTCGSRLHFSSQFHSRWIQCGICSAIYHIR